MKKCFLFIPLMLTVGNFIWTPNIYSDNKQVNIEELKEKAPKVFIDCRRCDMDYIRTEITYVNLVRDRKEADVHVLITDQRTGSGGSEYTFSFIGMKEFKGLNITLTYISHSTDTRDDIRRGMVEALKRGFFSYIVKTPLANYFSIIFKERLKPTAVKDKWNFWVFSISLDGNLDGERQISSHSIDINFSVNRITPDLKIRMGISADFDERRYVYGDETIISITAEKNFTALVAKSISEHWSAGGWLEASSSTYSNLDSLFTLAPAIEYNFFPYSVSTRRQLRLLYKIGFNSANYNEETIFGKNSEKLYNESLTATLELRERWGSASVSLEGSHYFHDFSKNRLELHGFLSFRIFEGLTMDIRGRYDLIRDQLSLPKGEATIDEILLRRKELATNYDYSLSLGLRYTFGSVFSNVVNPRFGTTRYRGRYRWR